MSNYLLVAAGTMFVSAMVQGLWTHFVADGGWSYSMMAAMVLMLLSLLVWINKF